MSIEFAIPYVRVSTDTQNTDAQVDAIRSWAATNNVPLDTFIREDEATSGRSEAVRRGPAQALMYYAMLAQGSYASLERGGYAELLGRVDRYIAAKRSVGVIFYSLDRISRDWLELGLLERLLTLRGVPVILVNQGGVIDTSTSTGRLMFRMQAILATHECEQTAERTSRSLRAKVKAGVKVGRPPVGWRKGAAGAFEHDPETWPMVERIAILRRQGNTYEQIVAATGVSMGMIKCYIDAEGRIPPAVATSETPAVPEQAQGVPEFEAPSQSYETVQ